MPAMQKSKKGITLVEVMVSALICAIVIIGASLFFVTGRSQVNLQGRYRQAVQLAAQKMEELKAGDYDELSVQAAEENLSFEEVSYKRGIKIEDAGLYKKADVTVYWSQMGKQRSVSLATYIAPR